MTLPIVSRQFWGARPPKYRNRLTIPTRHLILHHAAGAVLPDDDTISDEDLKRIRSIQRYHMDVRGWADIAYTLLTDVDGHVFEGRGPDWKGGHTFGMNSVAQGVCVMGNYDRQPVDRDEVVPQLAAVAVYLHDNGYIEAPRYTGGHRDFGDTSCPGRHLYPLIPEINQLAEEETMNAGQEAKLDLLVDGIRVVRREDGVPVMAGTDFNLAWHVRKIERELAQIKAGLDVDLDNDDIAAIVDAIADAGIAESVANEIAQRLVS